MTHDHSRSHAGIQSGRTERAQTQIDFAVGAGVFLLALAFVIGFVPSLFEPFSTAESASPIVSDRVAAGTVDLLGTSATDSTALHAPTNPGVLAPACTVAFFTANATLADEADCPFDASTPPDDLLEVDGDVQIVIHELDERDPALVDVETGYGTFEDVETIRASADLPTTADDVTVSRRVVSVNGAQYRLTVRVW